MKQYDKYKDSGIEWIGKIPTHWESKRMKFISKINPKQEKYHYPNDSGESVTFLPMDKVSEDGNIDVSLKKPINELSNGFTYFEKGDVIVAKITPCFENGKSAYLDNLDSNIGFGSTEFHVLRAIENTTIPKYLYYIIRSPMFKRVGEAFMFGAAGQKRVPTEFIKDFIIGYPHIEEQIQIANYLDRKTKQIDTLIQKKQKLIELLKEQRTAMINQAVTKGLDPNVPMKDSGIEWLGEIPKHWTMKKLKFLCRIQTGGKDTENKEEDGEYPFFVRSQTVERISTYSFDDEAILTAGDGVGVGKVFHYIKGKFDYHQRVYMLYNFKDVLGKYLFYYIKENLYKEVIKISAKSTVDSLRLPMFQNFIVVYGTQSEQKNIIDYIEQKMKKIDASINNENKAIDLLKEYRTSLISAAVTGKIDVREGEVIHES